MTRRPATGCSPGTYGGTARTDARIHGAGTLMRPCYGAVPPPATRTPSDRDADLGRTRSDALGMQVTLGHLDREPLAVRQARQHVDETRPAVAIGARELVETDCGVDVLAAQVLVGDPEHPLTRKRYAADLADAHHVGDAAALHETLGEPDPVFRLDDRRVPDEQLHGRVQKPALEISTP